MVFGDKIPPKKIQNDANYMTAERHINEAKLSKLSTVDSNNH